MKTCSNNWCTFFNPASSISCDTCWEKYLEEMKMDNEMFLKEEKKLGVGDVVQLRSSGPRMTVEEVGSGAYGARTKDDLLCVWFGGPDSVPQSRWFPAGALRRID